MEKLPRLYNVKDDLFFCQSLTIHYRSVNKEPAPVSSPSFAPSSLFNKGTNKGVSAATTSNTPMQQQQSAKTDIVSGGRGLLNGHFANQESNRQT